MIWYDMVYFKFQKAMNPMRIYNLTLFDGIKTVQNIDLYVLSISFQQIELSLLVLSGERVDTYYSYQLVSSRSTQCKGGPETKLLFFYTCISYHVSTDE